MSTHTYHEILNQVQRLAPADQLRLLEDLAAIIRQQVTTEPLHSVLEFEGVGEEVWKNINVEEYINQERDSWDG